MTRGELKQLIRETIEEISTQTLQERGMEWEEYYFAVPKPKLKKALAILKNIEEDKKNRVIGVYADPTEGSDRVSEEDAENWTDVIITKDPFRGMSMDEIEYVLNQNGVEIE